jgi:hypothetical protein
MKAGFSVALPIIRKGLHDLHGRHAHTHHLAINVLQAFQIRSPWTQLSALLAPAPALRGKTILEALKSGETERAIAMAASFGEQAA